MVNIPFFFRGWFWFSPKVKYKLGRCKLSLTSLSFCSSYSEKSLSRVKPCVQTTNMKPLEVFWMIEIYPPPDSSQWLEDEVSLSIGSMYGIFTNIWLICMVNVGKYNIHGMVWVWGMAKFQGLRSFFVE